MSDVKDTAGSPAPEADPLRARRIGPEDLKAFTHPLRMALFTALRDHGPATATQLAQRLGESTGQTSYHLRQLERHGFVEDDPGHASGRERWWRPVGFSVEGPEMLVDPEAAPSIRAVFDLMITDRVRVLREFADAAMAGRVELEDEAATTATYTIRLTPSEAKALVEEVQAVLDGYARRAKETEAPGAAGDRVRIHFDAIPLPGDPD